MTIRIEVEEIDPSTGKVYQAARLITREEFNYSIFDIMDSVTSDLIRNVEQAMGKHDVFK